MNRNIFGVLTSAPAVAVSSILAAFTAFGNISTFFAFSEFVSDLIEHWTTIIEHVENQLFFWYSEHPDDRRMAFSIAVTFPILFKSWTKSPLIDFSDLDIAEESQVSGSEDEVDEPPLTLRYKVTITSLITLYAANLGAFLLGALWLNTNIMITGAIAATAIKILTNYTLSKSKLNALKSVISSSSFFLYALVATQNLNIAIILTMMITSIVNLKTLYTIIVPILVALAIMLGLAQISSISLPPDLKISTLLGL
jgi:hypothetical protein